jgi:hypothetical protein
VTVTLASGRTNQVYLATRAFRGHATILQTDAPFQQTGPDYPTTHKKDDPEVIGAALDVFTTE